MEEKKSRALWRLEKIEVKQSLSKERGEGNMTRNSQLSEQRGSSLRYRS